ncbi:putative inactive carboxylesterase 4 [Branchiostoma lanceolatum]|uniref:putative inactive carboxylesterase 4 n=1 Tax=Branchiostoma lanceolatum TaxID=7740 RepID=UPI003456556F
MASQSVVNILVLTTTLSVCIDYGVTEDGPTVQTQFGAVRGKYVEEGVIFLGLPFAVPSVGELRWKPPAVYNTSWAPAVRDGTLPGPTCRQPKCGPTYNDVQHICNRDANRTQSEDCLYLNIFAPESALNSTVTPLPVLFWIHGRNYRIGTGAALVYDGRFLANKTQTVVVTINYRLGAFGFLETGEGEDDAKGNFGLLDQLEALAWVQENIGSFGGDKNKVTIFGQSAGSDSVATHMISNKTVGLFKQAIMMSIPFSIPHKSRQEALRLESFMQWGPSIDYDVVPAPTHLWDEWKFCNGHVCHGEDIPFVFQTPLLANLTFNTDEQHMADTIAYHYGNFAHTGDPNKPAHNINSTNNGKPKVVNWPNSTNGHFYGLNITTPESNLLDNYRHERCDVLDSLNVYH